MPSGADILGTVKRSPMFPFTYDQKLSSSDTRQVVDPSGFKTLFMKKLTVSGKNITGLAYRDGKGGVTLGLTTCEHMRHWDLVLEDPKCAKQQMGEEKLPWFEKLHDQKTASENNTYLFTALHVIPLTVNQNTPEWFLMRIFACTSSASDNLLADVKTMLLSPGD